MQSKMKLFPFFMAVVLLFSLFMQPFAQSAQVSAQSADKTYDTVVLRGDASALDWSTNNNPLTYNEEESRWVSDAIPLDGGTKVEYKFVMNDQWMGGANLSFTPPQSGNYFFYFNPSNERQVDVRLDTTDFTGSVTLNLTLPEATPGWVTPTVASTLNQFNYAVTPMTQTEDGTWQVELAGDAGETLEYRYGLGDSKFAEVIDQHRTATFTAEGNTTNDTVTEWIGIPVAKSVSHNFNHEPYIPSSEDAVTITTTVEHYGPITDGGIYYTTDGTSPEGLRGNATNGDFTAMTVTDTTEQNGLYTSTLTGVIPAQANETPVKYKLDVWDADGEASQFADTNSQTAEEATEFAYYVDQFRTPDWAKDAIIYHIFVDRFKDGNPDNNYDVDSSLPLEEGLKDWMGGDLEGVIDELDYLEDLGVDTLWLSPVFEGPYSHGYHPADFKEIDRNFGTLETMKELITKAHARDMKVIYDFVPNHTSDQHPFFQDAVERGADSPYYNWYNFNEDGTYETFYGIGELPQFNNDNEMARDYMLNEVVPFWLEELDFDGLRLDYAKGPSYSFWVDFRDKVKSIDPDVYVFGEVWDNRDKISSYAGKLDGSLDFGFHDTFKGTFAFNGSMQSIVRYLNENQAAYHPEYIMTTFLDNHDLPRFLYEAGNQTNRLKLASFTQFMLPGSPVIYYGTEVGLSQSANHNEYTDWKDRWYREPMIWDQEKQDQDLLAHYKDIIDLRKNHSALRDGYFKEHATTRDALVFERGNDTERLIIAVNKGEETTLELNEVLTLEDMTTGERIKSNELTIEANAFAAYLVIEELEIEQVSLTLGSENIELTYDEDRKIWYSKGIHLKNKQTVRFHYVLNQAIPTEELSFTPDRGGKFEFVFDPENPQNVTVLHPSDKKGKK
ncbi:alpha-amylase family glycosyl hydrolase [Bacillus sp. FJAT-45037]|uniref:alpha-amylase family glycosyl hydrolase n=1 Tax=Bacillus sp. FJAT-45037 TaxID=2011007 RepID=UPI001E4A7E06|nr:alpha-amylase family glycosyl hydrolase [Bacillus sp. FJAT-45037]